MTLTICIGSSGSGKTTFLNDVYEMHKCVYIRQYHSIRPYITVSKITDFDPTALPYWHLYTRDKTDQTVQIGGTMAGKFYAGLSGGQRKILLFELVYQRTINQEDLLIVLDEPFAGVTDDFVPYIMDRLNVLKQKHNILVVTNDHIQALKEMSDNTITVSAIDRTTVKINDRENFDREQALLAMSIGEGYVSRNNSKDLLFFYHVEIRRNIHITASFIFATIFYLLFIASLWNSKPNYSEPLITIAGGIVAYYSVNPYLTSLVDWRNLVTEETEALLHSSKDNFDRLELFLAILVDSASLTYPFICISLYTTLPFQFAHILGTSPFLFLIFLSTTYSPSSGLIFMNSFRFLFARFYLWCMLPGVRTEMSGCPTHSTMLFLVLSGFFNVFLFLTIKGAFQLVLYRRKQKGMDEVKNCKMDDGFNELQLELFGDRTLKRFKELQTKNSFRSSGSFTLNESCIDNGHNDEEQNGEKF